MRSLSSCGGPNHKTISMPILPLSNTCALARSSRCALPFCCPLIDCRVPSRFMSDRGCLFYQPRDVRTRVAQLVDRGMGMHPPGPSPRKKKPSCPLGQLAPSLFLSAMTDHSPRTRLKQNIQTATARHARKTRLEEALCVSAALAKPPTLLFPLLCAARQMNR
jgi:hypothetical protein